MDGMAGAKVTSMKVNTANLKDSLIMWASLALFVAAELAFVYAVFKYVGVF